jgi:hypothetical protein
MTKPTGRPRGRPKKLVAPIAPRQAHRPPGVIWFDRDRFLLALLVFLEENGRSSRWATGAVAFLERNEVQYMYVLSEDFPLSERQKRLAKNKVGLSLRPFDTQPRTTPDVRNRAKALEKKLMRYQRDPAASLWLQKMATAMRWALSQSDPRLKAKAVAELPALGRVFEVMIPGN